jgi:hypothetical protein
MNRIQENIKFTETIRLIDSSGVEIFCSFWKNDKYLEYLSTEVGKNITC